MRKRSLGFTLIELLVVLAILGMLAALVGPRLIRALGKGEVESTKAQIGLLSTALTQFRIDNGRFPTQEEGLKALLEPPSSLRHTWAGPYLAKKEIPKDAWGRPFRYNIPPRRGGVDYDLYSLGPDGQEGTADDIGNWE